MNHRPVGELRFAIVLSVTALLVATVYGLFLFRTVQQFVDFDQYQYYWNINRSLTGSRPLPIFNPHHLHLEFLGERFHVRVVELLGDAGFTDLAFNLRLRSLLTATLGVFGLILFLGFATRSVFVALATTAAIAFSHGYLLYATKIDTGIYPTVALVALLCFALWTDRSPNPLAPIGLAISMFAAVMAHVYMGIACVVVGLVLLLPPVDRVRLVGKPFAWIEGTRKRFRDGHPRRVVATLTAGVAAILLIVGAYVFVGRGVYNLPYSGEPDTGSRDLFAGQTFQEWLFLYEVVSDAWGYGLSQFSPDQPFRGYTDAFLSRTSSFRTYGITAPFEYDLSRIEAPEAFAFNALALLTIVTLLASLLLFPLLLRRYGRAFLMVFGPAPPFFVFFTYWEPGYMEFWLVPVVIVLCLFGLIANLIGEWLGRLLPSRAGRLAAPARRVGPCVSGVRAALGRLAPAVLVAAFAFVLAMHNSEHYIIPFTRMQIREGLPLSWSESSIVRIYSQGVYREPIDERWEEQPSANGPDR